MSCPAFGSRGTSWNPSYRRGSRPSVGRPHRRAIRDCGHALLDPGDPRLRCGAAYSGAQGPTPPTRSTVMRTTKPGDEWRIGGNLTPGPR